MVWKFIGPNLTTDVDSNIQNVAFKISTLIQVKLKLWHYDDS